MNKDSILILIDEILKGDLRQKYVFKTRCERLEIILKDFLKINNELSPEISKFSSYISLYGEYDGFMISEQEIMDLLLKIKVKIK
ncbi:MAG: hypothetical protein ACRC8F_07860 [Cetobacterium sp.]